MSDLPQGWAETTVGEITEPFAATDPTKEPNREFQYIDIGSIDNISQTIRAPKILLGKDAPSRARRVVQRGDVLFSTVRTYLRNIAKVPSALDGALTSTGIAVLRPSKAVESEFLFKWVCFEPFVAAMSKAQDGTMYPAVTDKDVAGGRIPLPPLSEQRRIVGKLNGLFARTKAARDEVASIPILIEHYKRAILEQAFSGDLTADWRPKAAVPAIAPGRVDGLLASPIRNGLSIRGSDEPPGFRSLRLSALRTHLANMDDVRFLPIDANRAYRYMLAEGDVLVSRGNGTKSFVGLASLVPPHNVETIFPDTAFRIRLDNSRALPEWFTVIWNAPQVRRQIEAAAKTTAGIWKVSQADLCSVELYIPHVDEQREIVRRVEASFAWLATVDDETEKARHLLGHLDQGLLSKAFRGELVPQDPDDEPAEKLLERIRAARGGQPRARRGRRARAGAAG